MFICPCDGILTSKFGKRRDPHNTAKESVHEGVDFGANNGKPIFAVAEGRISMKRILHKIYGNEIRITHNNGFTTWYGHMSEFGKKLPYKDIEVGDRIRAGQMIGRVGNTGSSTGPHLHFVIIDPSAPVKYYGARCVDPLRYI
jgi:murein DD-endopeptidase MepM/ murein hydrolase activator NlpD